ncbi:hypothetical protein RF11_14626 [Thelohanellus kitauei]|uniref:Uncharacterized protein n=1 Tax=Thelohanellus kitauei TaxID=669202 RepID=A0A0C2N2D0_THEKT|nr:hypothetical protein RF11_14626 [Thelohanellus kitauei]
MLCSCALCLTAESSWVCQETGSARIEDKKVTGFSSEPGGHLAGDQACAERRVGNTPRKNVGDHCALMPCPPNGQNRRYTRESDLTQNLMVWVKISLDVLR